MSQVTRFAHERLDAYHVALEMVAGVETLVADFPRGHSELKDQLRRSASSVVRNIAEGANRWPARDKASRFVSAHGECGECHASLAIALAIGVITKSQFRPLVTLADRVAAMPSGLIQREMRKSDP